MTAERYTESRLEGKEISLDLPFRESLQVKIRYVGLRKMRDRSFEDQGSGEIRGVWAPVISRGDSLAEVGKVAWEEE